MTDYEYIYQQAKKSHFTQWDENELRMCQEVLPNLTREQLVKLYRNIIFQNNGKGYGNISTS